MFKKMREKSIWQAFGILAVIALFTIALIPDNILPAALANDDAEYSFLSGAVSSFALSKYQRHEPIPTDWYMADTPAPFGVPLVFHQDPILFANTNGNNRDILSYISARSPPVRSSHITVTKDIILST